MKNKNQETEFMIMSGIEDACLDMEAGRPVKAHLKRVVEKLRTGDYKIINNLLIIQNVKNCLI